MRAEITVVDASSWRVVDPEPGGRHAKEWLVDPSGYRWLFKTVVVKSGRRQGEDWAEVASAELAKSLTVPAAEVKMARRQGESGCISRDLKPSEPGWEMQTGAVVLQGVYPDFEVGSKARTGHSLDNIESLLREYQCPPGFDGPAGFDAFEVFCGYLVFDAIVANRDRHEENWSVLRDPTGVIRLAGSYDHASSLGFGETDAARSAALAGSPGVEHWAKRGTAYRFEGASEVTLVDFAAGALARVRQEVREYWLDHVTDLACDTWSELLQTTPGMSEVTRRFCTKLVEINRRRMLDAC